jgi:hypothetical protein
LDYSSLSFFRQHRVESLSKIQEDKSILEDVEYAYNVPKVVWIFWFGDNLSEKRRQNLAKMERILQLKVMFLQESNIKQYLHWPVHPAVQFLSDIDKSDYYRTYFLLHYGGGYTDIKPPIERWDIYFNEFKNEETWLVGVPEIEGGVAVSPNTKLPDDAYKSLISNCFMIARKGNEILKLVHKWQHEILSRKMNELRKHPPPFSRCCANHENGYPLRWAELQGELMSAACYPRVRHLRAVMKMTNLSDYL